MVKAGKAGSNPYFATALELKHYFARNCAAFSALAVTVWVFFGVPQITNIWRQWPSMHAHFGFFAG
jgi:hypothetical protein